MTKKTENQYFKWAIEYLMYEYGVNEEEGESMLASNPQLLNPMFGLLILAHHYAKEV